MIYDIKWETYIEFTFLPETVRPPFLRIKFGPTIESIAFYLLLGYDRIVYAVVFSITLLLINVLVILTTTTALYATLWPRTTSIDSFSSNQICFDSVSKKLRLVTSSARVGRYAIIYTYLV